MNLDDIRIFDDLQSQITKLGEKWKDNHQGGKKINTLSDLQTAMQRNNNFVNNERVDLNAKIKELREVWSNNKMAEKSAQLNAEFNKLAQSITKAAREDVASMINAKKEAIADMLATPPSSDQLSLLKALEMRGDNVDAFELQLVMSSLFGNYQSMKILQNIAKQSGNSISLPAQLDCRAMFDSLSEVESYLLEACNHVATSYKNIPIEYRAFYSVNHDETESHHDPRYNDYIQLLDTLPQLNSCNITKSNLTKSESALIKWLFKDVDKLDPNSAIDDIAILRQTKRIMEEHPETVDLLKLSEYGKYVTEVEAAATDSKNTES